MKSNIISQLKYMWMMAGKIWSFLIKNWLTIGTTWGMLVAAYTVASPYLDQKAEKYGARILAPSFKALEDRQDSLHIETKTAQDSIRLSIENIKGAKTDTALIRTIVNESFVVVINEMPAQFEKLFNGKMEALQVDTVWSVNPYTGEKLGFFTFSVDARGRLILYDH